MNNKFNKYVSRDLLLEYSIPYLSRKSCLVRCAWTVSNGLAIQDKAFALGDSMSLKIAAMIFCDYFLRYSFIERGVWKYASLCARATRTLDDATENNPKYYDEAGFYVCQ